MFRKYSAGSRDGKIVLVNISSYRDPDFVWIYGKRNIEAKK
jgi:hypothetical protein